MVSIMEKNNEEENNGGRRQRKKKFRGSKRDPQKLRSPRNAEHGFMDFNLTYERTEKILQSEGLGHSGGRHVGYSRTNKS